MGFAGGGGGGCFKGFINPKPYTLNPKPALAGLPWPSSLQMCRHWSENTWMIRFWGYRVVGF